ncbi:MAG: Gmad2 immunoglobulin-like domain-containing protein [Egibacteraceae bacterium]
MYRHRTLITAAACGLLLVGCGRGGDTAAAPTTPPPAATTTTAPAPTPAGPTTAGPTATPTDEAPTAAPDPTTTTTTTPVPTEVSTGAEEVLVFFVRSGDSGEWVEPETHALAEPTAGVARAAVSELVAGDVLTPGLTTLVPDGTTVNDVAIDGRTLVVDLSAAIADGNLGSAGEVALAQQLAHTGAQFDTVDDVQLLVDGAPAADLYGHLDWSQPIAPDLFALSPITFDTHTWGEQVAVGEVTVGGEANTFEANVPLRLVDPDGTVVDETFTTATSGTGERGRWEFTFDLTGPGRWTIEATEDDPSDGEGRPPFTTSLELEATA